VYLPTWASWDVMRQRPQYLLAAFAHAGHDVYFVDPREPAPRHADGVRLVPDLRHVPGRQVILYVHFAPVRTQFEQFESPVVVYDILDDLSIYEPDEEHLPTERRVAAHHPPVVRDADAVIASSPTLIERHRGERADIQLVLNGVDTERFAAPASRPEDLPATDRPRIGFHGAIGRWIDLDLAASVAELRPDWELVFVGPVAPEVAAAAAALEERDNVTFLGERPSDAMPGYVQSFDVGAVWFRIDHLTEAVVPLKMYEYLAAGVQVVSTPLPIAGDEPEVRVAGDAEAFVAAVSDALAEREDPGSRERLLAAGASASWGERLRPVLDRLDEAGLRRAPSER
jgi:UDP-galactopyranose mutase